ncbi:uncharacterized protein LOC132195041 [Neocloeon triangulifer]|uniref:uncharacterized protein LOC132195041 n=1 Tax=Neocloeon triangulifer TaxID=2078957 RepID=UPI00286F08D9|nr:uncharacterized protein LOC132195041 [Neocloeon triangulifer]
MEFDSTVLDFQRRLHSLQNEFGNLQEAEIPAEKLAPVLEKWSAVIEKKEEVLRRKIHLYLVLNTNFPFCSGVEVSDDVAHLTGSAPLLSPRLLIALVRGCHLMPYAYETISFADPVLALHYSDVVLRENSGLSALDTLDEVFSVMNSIFIQLGSCRTPNVQNKLASEFIKVNNSLSQILVKKLKDLSSLEKLEAAGITAKKLIELVLLCMQVMLEAPKNPDDFYLRNLFATFDYGQWPESGDFDLMGCFDRVVDQCERSFKAIDVDRWISWEAVKGQTEGKNLQMEIGEATYRCVEFEPKPSKSVKQLSAILLGFQLKPVSEFDLADLDRVISKLEERPKKEWLSALLTKNDAFKDYRTVQMIEKHSELWDFEIVSNILKLATHPEACDAEKLKSVVLEAFKTINIEEQKTLINSYFKEFGIGTHFKASNFDSQVTTVLNRSSNFETMREKWLPEFLILSLQSPKELVEKSVVSGYASRGQGTLVALALSEIASLCTFPCDGTTVLLSALKSAISDIDPSTSHLTHFVQQLEERGLIKSVDFIKCCVLPTLKSDLGSYRVPYLLLWVQLLKRLLKVDSAEQVDLDSKLSLAVLLAVLAEILQRASWVLGKFKHAESLLRAETVLLVRPLACRYANSITNPEDKELLWLRTGLLRLTSHNRAHFSAIWTHFNLPVPSMNMGSLLLSREAMHQQSGMPPGGPDQLLSPLLILLPSCCTPEWRLLITSLAKVLSSYNVSDQEVEDAEERDEIKMLPDAIRLLVTALMLQALMLSQQQPPDDANYSNECALACLENSIRNLGIIMKEEWLPKLTDTSEVENGAGVVRQVALLLRSLPSSISSSCSLALSGVLQQAHEVLLLQAGMQTDLATWCAQELALSLALLPDREARQSLARKLLIEPALAQV